MEFVKASENDLEELSILENSCFQHPFKDKDLLYEIKDNPVAYFYLLKNDNEIIGFIDFWITFDSATICQICVKDSYKKQGFAGKLIDFACNVLKENDVLYFTLEVRESNFKAINLYKKHGFQEVTIKEKYYEDGENAIYFVKGVL